MDKDKIIIGIDPGTNLLGYGIIRMDKKGPHYETMGVINLRKEKNHFDKIARIFKEINLLIDKFSPNELALESAFYAKDVQVVQKLGRVQGVVIAAAINKGIPVSEYAPRKAKMAITGQGAASKEQVAMMIKRILKVEDVELPLDATDALAIALCHYYQLSNPIASLGNKTDWKKFLDSNPDRVVKVNPKKL